MVKLQKIRCRTFYRWHYRKSFVSRMIKAGFFACNVKDRVICIHCDLICQEWDAEIDDPCQVHKLLSPNCSFVKQMSRDPLRSTKSVFTLPYYTNYVDPQERLASFSTLSHNKFLPIDKLADAGFFYSDSKITCFYCNGSFECWEFNNHPILEHVRLFPYCNYARQLCGEELYYKIQRSLKDIPGL